MSSKSKAWITLACTAIGSGCAVSYGAIMSGAHGPGVWLLGIGTAATAVVHALQASPNDQSTNHSEIPNSSNSQNKP